LKDNYACSQVRRVLVHLTNGELRTLLLTNEH
jgi:hypothetical protein